MLVRSFFRGVLGQRLIPSFWDEPVADAATPPVLEFTFETPGEGSGGTESFVSTGTLAAVGAVDGGNCERVTDEHYSGAASCRIRLASSFGFSLGGSTAMDLGAAGGVLELAFMPHAAGVPVLFDWGTAQENRMTVYLDTGEPKIAVGNANVFTTIASGGLALPLDEWATWRLELNPGGVSRSIVNGVLRGSAAIPGAFTVAHFGNLVRVGRLAFTGANHFDGWVDSIRYTANT